MNQNRNSVSADVGHVACSIYSLSHSPSVAVKNVTITLISDLTQLIFH